MTRPQAEYDEVLRLIAWGLNDCQVSRLTGVPRCTIRDWRLGRTRHVRRKTATDCPVCSLRVLEESTYAYLLGIYLGDGYIVRMPRTYRLRVFLDLKYPDIIDEAAAAMGIIRMGQVGRLVREGCIELSSYWNHWPCVFPQHGSGMKHERDIRLESWQQEIVDRHPENLLRGLIHSDGSRDLNFVTGKSYPRYQFSNNSADIQEIFCHACELFGIHWTRPYWKTVSISRRPDVEKLDRVIGPKS